MLYPFTFEPTFKARIWGGRNLERLYGKELPPMEPIGESWEIVDRPEAVSVINNGSLAGKSLRWLMEQHGREVLGSAGVLEGRFPLLVKILDAQTRLSLQVHPPAHLAAELGGEPKSEMWYVAEARAGAELFAGLKCGTTRAQFEARIKDGSVADCFHHIRVKTGDAMFLPSGRVHAIGGSAVIFEVQQNSDTTYRVFDWNRLDANGKARELHVEQSLRCIDFNDFEPGLVLAKSSLSRQQLVENDLFQVELRTIVAGEKIDLNGSFAILGIVAGEISLRGFGQSIQLKAGQFSLLPAALSQLVLDGKTDSRYLWVKSGGAVGERAGS